MENIEQSKPPLAKLLKEYRKKHNLDQKHVAEKTGLSLCTVKSIEGGQNISDYTVYLLSEKLSSDFKPYVNYTQCAVCGTRFIARKQNIKTCSPTCSETRRRTFQDRWCQKNSRPKKSAKKIKAEEFETLSRAAGLTYGQRQTLERLGQLNTEPKILWGT